MMKRLFFRRTKKIEQISSSDIILVDEAEKLYANLPLKNYGVPLRVKNRDRVEVIFPRLTPDGDVEYLYSWHNIDDVEVPGTHGDEKNVWLRAVKHLAPLIKEHLQIEQEIISLEKQHREISDLADLVSTSDMYSSQLELYDRALVQIENLLKKAEQLQAIYIHLVREALIGVRIAGYNPESIQDNRLAFDSQYQRIRSEYQHLKDVATAYAELRREI
jgi:hypothetical protein